MTARELIERLQGLNEADLDREVITFDGPAYGIVTRVKVLGEEGWGKELQGKIVID